MSPDELDRLERVICDVLSDLSGKTLERYASTLTPSKVLELVQALRSARLDVEESANRMRGFIEEAQLYSAELQADYAKACAGIAIRQERLEQIGKRISEIHRLLHDGANAHEALHQLLDEVHTAMSPKRDDGIIRSDIAPVTPDKSTRKIR